MEETLPKQEICYGRVFSINDYNDDDFVFQFLDS